MPRKSAGLLLYRLTTGKLEVLLVHPGGPFWANKDAEAWSIPKGEFEENEEALNAAMRETEEELGIKVEGKFIELSPVKQKSGKLIFAWTLERDVDITKFTSNTFEIEWPPHSGKTQSFPEVDKAAWLTIAEAKGKINPGQSGLLDQLEKILG